MMINEYQSSPPILFQKDIVDGLVVETWSRNCDMILNRAVVLLKKRISQNGEWQAQIPGIEAS